MKDGVGKSLKSMQVATFDDSFAMKATVIEARRQRLSIIIRVHTMSRRPVRPAAIPRCYLLRRLTSPFTIRCRCSVRGVTKAVRISKIFVCGSRLASPTKNAEAGTREMGVVPKGSTIGICREKPRVFATIPTPNCATVTADAEMQSDSNERCSNDANKNESTVGSNSNIGFQPSANGVTFINSNDHQIECGIGMIGSGNAVSRLDAHDTTHPYSSATGTDGPIGAHDEIEQLNTNNRRGGGSRLGTNGGDNNDKESGMSLEELIYGASSFHAIVKPGNFHQKLR